MPKIFLPLVGLQGDGTDTSDSDDKRRSPTPTQTRTPAASKTPVPSPTKVPTRTPIPSPTRAPTTTPRPSPTPAATKTPTPGATAIRNSHRDRNRCGTEPDQHPLPDNRASGVAADRHRPDHPHRGPPAHRSADRERPGDRGLELRHHVPRHGTHPAGPRPARGLGVRPAHLRRLHHGARHRLGARRRECAGHHHSRQRPHRAQPDGGHPVHPGSRHPLLPPARAGLGGHGQRPVGRPGGHQHAGQSPSPTGPTPARPTSRRCKAGSRSFVNSGQLGLFANGYWGHPAYKLPPEANLLAVAHYLEALDWQRELIKIHALLGGKNPHPQTYLVGGMAIPVDPASRRRSTRARIAQLKSLAAQALDFVQRVYYPDLLLIASLVSRLGRPSAAARATSCPSATFPDNSGNLAGVLSAARRRSQRQPGRAAAARWTRP